MCARWFRSDAEQHDRGSPDGRARRGDCLTSLRGRLRAALLVAFMLATAHNVWDTSTRYAAVGPVHPPLPTFSDPQAGFAIDPTKNYRQKQILEKKREVGWDAFYTQERHDRAVSAALLPGMKWQLGLVIVVTLVWILVAQPRTLAKQPVRSKI